MELDGGDAWQRVFVLVGSIVLGGVLIIFLQAILVPFVLAIFLAYLVRPFAEFISNNLCAWRLKLRERARRGREAQSREEAASLLPRRGEPSSSSAADASPPPPPGPLLPSATLRNLEEASIQIGTELPRWVGVVLAMSLAVTIFASIVLLMAASISSLGSRLDAYRRRARTLGPTPPPAFRRPLPPSRGPTPPPPRRYQHRAHELWAIVVHNLKPLGLNLSDTSELPSRAIAAVLTPLLNFSLGLLNYCMLGAQHAHTRGCTRHAPHAHDCGRSTSPSASSTTACSVRACTREDARATRRMPSHAHAHVPLTCGARRLARRLAVLIFLIFLLLEPAAPRSSLRKRIDDSISRYSLLLS